MLLLLLLLVLRLLLQYFPHAAACDTNPATTSPTVEYNCSPPVNSSQTCTASCVKGFRPGPAGLPTATCDNGTWVTTPGNDSIVCYPIVTAPDVVYQVSKSTVTLSFTGGCSSQAGDAAVNGLIADLQQQLAAAAVPNMTASVHRTACTNSQVLLKLLVLHLLSEPL
jgi:hypothetical protein